MRHVSVDILTGFLGSGKTTLLTEMLSAALANEKVAVVMNEIGEVGVDARVVTGMDFVENVVELNSGCICCTIDDYRFDLAIQELIDTVEPTLIIIESTGLADPEPVIYRINQAGLALDAVITVVDAANLDAALADTQVAREQVEAADFIVINKIDLVSPSGLRRIRSKLGRLNPRAAISECERGQVSSDLLFGTSVRSYREQVAAPGASRHLEADAIAAFTFRSDIELDQQRFERFLGHLPPAIYRAKGFVRFAGNPWSCLFNFTCGRFELKWVRLGSLAGQTQAVFIGKGIDALRPKIESELAACCVNGAQ